MTDHLDLPQRDYGQYEQMTAEELAAVLRADFEAEKGLGLDDETLLYVMQLYALRQPVKSSKTAEEAFSQFSREHLAPVSTDDDRSDMHRRRTRRWRYATTAAAVVALVLCAGLFVRAGVPKSTQTVYRQNRDHLIVAGGYTEEAVENIRKIAEPCFPQWLPEGYERVQTRWSNTTYAEVYYRGEQSEEDCLSVHFQTIVPGRRMRFCKSPEAVKVFTHDGVRFYLYTNAQWNCAVGDFDGVMFSITAKVSDEEMLQIVQSMQLSVLT